jgi:hypothetical protein
MAVARIGNFVVAAGSDEQGLMYALLEIAEQLSLEGRRLADLSEISVSPETSLRGVFSFLHNADCEREWFGSERYWSAYFDLMADSRFNSFQLVMGHQTNYLAPPFPFFIEVPEHPEVVVPGHMEEDRRKNLDALKMITGLAATRGIEFVLGIWEVIAWWPQSRGGHIQRSMVDGLGWENLADYTYHATRRLLTEVPGIRGIQLRVNGESGVPEQHQTEFFASTFFKAMAEAENRVFLDLRGWIAKKETIEAAQEFGIPMRLSMKYWAEHLGAPYQAAEQEPAYSYADFLRHPREYDVSYQVWALGSHRHFVWGDPEFVRTFAKSLHFGDALGYEISPPLAQKGYGNEPGAWRVLHPEYEYYEWEWERYWFFFLLFGRITYDVSDSSWMRWVRARFESRADAVLEAYVAGSQVVSFIIRFNMSDPNMYIWPEADTGGILDFYMAAPTSDPARMKGFLDAAHENVSGALTARLGPRWAAGYLERVGRRCLEAVRSLSATKQDKGRQDRELRSLAVDIEALGELALYHAEKIRAADHLALYYASGERGMLHDARRRLAAARPHWERLAMTTDGVYTDHQVTGPIDNGHWKDKLRLVAEDEDRIEERIALHRDHGSGTLGGAVAAFDFGGQPPTAYTYTRIPVHHNMVEQGFVGVGHEVHWRSPMTTPYGWEVFSGLARRSSAPLARFCDRHLDTIFRDTMANPGYDELVPFTNTLYRDYVGGDGVAAFHAVVPAGAYEVTVMLGDDSPDPRGHGPFDISINGIGVASSLMVHPGERKELRTRVELDRGELSALFAANRGGTWFCSAIVVRPLEPCLAHLPLRVAPADEPLSVRLSVTAVTKVTEVFLHIDGGDTILMHAGEDDCYHAVIDGSRLRPGQVLRYRFSATTEDGVRSVLPMPDEADSQPWFEIRGIGQDQPGPVVIHEPLDALAPGVDVDIDCAIESGSEIVRAVLHYRRTNQYYRWQRLALRRLDTRWTARIPGTYIVPEWDVMYYIEAVDENGQGTIAPRGDDLHEIPYWVASPIRTSSSGY